MLIFLHNKCLGFVNISQEHWLLFGFLLLNLVSFSFLDSNEEFDCVYYRETLFWVNIQDKKRRIENSMPYNYTLNVSLDKLTSFFSLCNIGAEQATVNWGHRRGHFILMIISTCLGNPLNSTPLLTFTSKISPTIHLQVLNRVMR